MANLRLVIAQVIDNTTIKARFTENLDPAINKSNIIIESNRDDVPSPLVLSTSIDKDVITIKTQLLTQYVPYYVKFKSNSFVKFKSINGSYLVEDNITNIVLLLGVEEQSSVIKDELLQYQKDGPFNLENGTIVKDIINSQAELFSKALYDIGQLKNDNYISVEISDEEKTRGTGPFDRFNEEGAYEITRVSKNKSGSFVASSKFFELFPETEITLQSVSIFNEKFIIGLNSDVSILTVLKNPVTKLNKLKIVYQNGTNVNYDIFSNGYKLKDPRYDDYASTLLTLDDNQIKLNLTNFILPKAGDIIYIDYEYKDLGIYIDESSVTVSKIVSAIRQETPAIKSLFNIGHFPILISKEEDVIATNNGIDFLDPMSNPPLSSKHPAFLKEIPFRLESLPINFGEYSVNYETGDVYVFGADKNDGTGPFPPVITYNYRQYFVKDLDFTYDTSLLEIVANPLRDLAKQNVKINFTFEKVLIPDVDYKANIHTEIINERINNKLIYSNVLKTEKNDITNVFRIYNETTGEVYNITRWSGNKIYFSGNFLPRILDVTKERASFSLVSDEILIIDEEFINILGNRIYKILLSNNNIISSTEDLIASSFNTSAQFSRIDIFNTELYFDNQTYSVSDNTDRLDLYEYQIDYVNGIIYVCVSNSDNLDVGTISYRKSTIEPKNYHLISVSEIFNSIDNNIKKRISYTDFGDDYIQPEYYNLSDERFFNNDTTLPYIVENNKIKLSDDIEYLRGIYDHYDLTHNINPINFADNCLCSSNTITLGFVTKTEALTIQSGKILNTTFVTPGAEIINVRSVIRTSDNLELWSSSVGTFLGYNINLLLGSVGEEVIVTYDISLNSSATPIVDYGRGEYFIDYSFLADEILVSYEYGDNNLDFRESFAINPGETYYVSYKAGALRDALVKNFGTLINIPILNNLDISIGREKYRDAIKGALQSFTKGPTIEAIKSLVSNVTHIVPELKESAFDIWSLGYNKLYPQNIKTTGDIKLLSGKFDSGVLLDKSGQSITFPISSNLRLEEGTIEMWVIPEWSGLDNDADLTFELYKDGYILDNKNIFIGSSSYNPKSNIFTINRFDEVNKGMPSKIYTSIGIFIYYNDIEKKWRVYAKDKSIGIKYTGIIQSSGEVYDVKFIPGLGEVNDILRSGISKIDFEFNIDSYDVLYPDGYQDGYSLIDGYFPSDGYLSGYSFDGITFMADKKHYLFDFGKDNRFSIFKDGSGYLNFQVIDKNKKRYEVSSDVSNWLAGQKHHVAVSWKLDSSDLKDEMHLFIDGFEVPNIMRFGGKPKSTSTDRFRTIKPEYLIGTVTKNAIVGKNLITTVNSNIVKSSSVNFESLNILPGDSIIINEPGFSVYNIISVDNYSLILDTNMQVSLLDARFSINSFSSVVSSEIDLFSNIAVYVLRQNEEFELPGLRAVVPSYSVSKNMLNENILTILGNVFVGDQVIIKTFGLNHRRIRDKKYLWNSSNLLKTKLSPPINLDEVKINSIILPLESIGPSNSVFSLGNFLTTLNPKTQPSNNIEGRTLSVKVTGGNVVFPVTITINGSATETLIFSSAGTLDTINKYSSVSNIDVIVKPLVSTKNSISIEIKEKYSITYSEGNNIYPIIRYSYKTNFGNTLSGVSGDSIVTDINNTFSESYIGQSLVITNPIGAANYYKITDVNNNSLSISPNIPISFSNGNYEIYNVSIGRSGYSNGYFILETAGETSVPFMLNKGYYEFDYSSWIQIPFNPINEDGYLGSDIYSKNQANAIIDEFRILSNKLTDIRVGEIALTNEKYVTTDYMSLNPFKSDFNTLMLMHLDSIPLTNVADIYEISTKQYIQSSSSVNDNFGKSLMITNKPLIIENEGYLSTLSEGTIEFWVNPKFDTYNDPEDRFYFDACSSISENIISLTNFSIKINSSSNIKRILSIKTLDGKEYTGKISSDFKTVILNNALPYGNTPVIINYIQSGTNGDRICIYKNKEGYIVFSVTASGVDYEVRKSIFWERNSWHRIQATFKFNRKDNKDELRLFVDGEESGILLFGQGLLFGSPGLYFGQNKASQTSSLITDINFKDSLNEFYIGSDYFGNNLANAKFDNFRLSNIARQPLFVSNQVLDINYNSNINSCYPVTQDLYTTYLLDFDTMINKVNDFSILRDEKYGLFSFILNIIDSFGIVSNDNKIKEILDTLISVLKPANSKVTKNYV